MNGRSQITSLFVWRFHELLPAQIHNTFESIAIRYECAVIWRAAKREYPQLSGGYSLCADMPCIPLGEMMCSYSGIYGETFSVCNENKTKQNIKISENVRCFTTKMSWALKELGRVCYAVRHGAFFYLGAATAEICCLRPAWRGVEDLRQRSSYKQR